ncbi:hypothetical protein Q31b_37560 [Novipirellula aureliae]|uniref:Uncharacterized protein n=1 Tax=Novipirellula aureliae TaxID=2527966 RepID=A0A5C6DPL9_9BACT|nr:hypothetical protein Q31b_37560 [Novipirellula aureliae]
MDGFDVSWDQYFDLPRNWLFVNVIQLASSELNSEVLITVAAGFSLGSIFDAVANCHGAATVRAKNGNGHGVISKDDEIRESDRGRFDYYGE